MLHRRGNLLFITHLAWDLGGLMAQNKSIKLPQKYETTISAQYEIIKLQKIVNFLNHYYNQTNISPIIIEVLTRGIIQLMTRPNKYKFIVMLLKCK